MRGVARGAQRACIRPALAMRRAVLAAVEHLTLPMCVTGGHVPLQPETVVWSTRLFGPPSYD